MKIYTIQQRVTDFVEITLYGTWGAYAFFFWVVIKATGARVYTRNQHKIRRITNGYSSSRDRDMVLFEGLSEDLKGRTFKFRKLV
jgi:hypothetical protein